MSIDASEVHPSIGQVAVPFHRPSVEISTGDHGTQSHQVRCIAWTAVVVPVDLRYYATLVRTWNLSDVLVTDQLKR